MKRSRPDEATRSRWRRRPGVLVVALTLAGAALVPATPMGAADAGASPGPASPTVVADGAFGRVAGVTAASDASPGPDTLPVLDAWAVGTRIRFEPTDGTLAPWTA